MPYAPVHHGGTNYPTPDQTYPIRQRRGLFGGLFRRRNRRLSASPYGTTYTTTTYGYGPGYTTYTYTAPY